MDRQKMQQDTGGQGRNDGGGGDACKTAIGERLRKNHHFNSRLLSEGGDRKSEGKKPPSRIQATVKRNKKSELR